MEPPSNPIRDGTFIYNNKRKILVPSTTSQVDMGLYPARNTFFLQHPARNLVSMQMQRGQRGWWSKVHKGIGGGGAEVDQDPVWAKDSASNGGWALFPFRLGWHTGPLLGPQDVGPACVPQEGIFGLGLSARTGLRQPR